MQCAISGDRFESIDLDMIYSQIWITDSSYIVCWGDGGSVGPYAYIYQPAGK